MDHNNNNNLASASFDTMNEPLIPTQTIATVIPTIPAISNNILNTSTVTSINESNNLHDYNHIHNNISNTNTDFELSIDDLSYFIDSDEKNIATVQSTLVTPDRIEDKAFNTVIPSIPANFNNILNSSTENTINEHHNLKDYKVSQNNVAISNTDFDLNIDYSSDFMDITERNDATVQPTFVTNNRIEDKAIYLTPGYLSVTFNVFSNRRVCCNGQNKKLCYGGIQNICHADLVYFLAGSYFFSGFLLF